MSDVLESEVTDRCRFASLRRAAPGLFEANAGPRDLLYYFRVNGLSATDHDWAVRAGVAPEALEQLGIHRCPGEVKPPKRRHRSRLLSKE